MDLAARCIIARDNNVVLVDFRREPDPPAPRFPGAGAMRIGNHSPDLVEGSSLRRQAG